MTAPHDMGTAAFWDGWSRVYDTVYAYHRVDCEDFADLCPSTPGGMKILDIATGHGWVAEALRRRNPGPTTLVVATDVSPAMLQAAALRFRSADLAIATQVLDAAQPQQLSALLRQHGAFDLITCYWGVNSMLGGAGHGVTIRRLLEQWSTLLAPNGRIIVDWDTTLVATLTCYTLDPAGGLLRRLDYALDEPNDYTTLDQAFARELEPSSLLTVERTVRQWQSTPRDPAWEQRRTRLMAAHGRATAADREVYAREVETTARARGFMCKHRNVATVAVLKKKRTR